MNNEIVESLVSVLISELVSEGKSLFRELKDEGASFLEVGIKKYLIKQSERYSRIKTLLQGNTPAYLYDIYFPLKLTDSRDRVIETEKISDVFEKSNFITLIGDAGSGKSTLVKHLFINTLKTKFGIPILVELRYLNDSDLNFKDYIMERLLHTDVTGNTRIMERLLENGKFVFFLDGFDELKSSVKPKLIQDLEHFISSYYKNQYLLTSRPYSNIEGLQNFVNYKVKELSLSDGEVDGFVEKQLASEPELSSKITESISNNQTEFIKSFLSNPLLLSLYILTFQSNASIPDKKYIFYRRVIQALFSEHDSKSKLGFVREKVSGLSQETFEDILRTFCFISYFENEFSWEVDYVYEKFQKIRDSKELKFDSNDVLTDLKSSVALWVEDGGDYSFAHRSLQEYFAAVFIKHLNPVEKERIYKKILELSQDSGRGREGENLLSLLEEMDIYSFKQYYLLPVLHELRTAISTNSDEDLVCSFITFFCEGIVLGDHEADLFYPDIRINDNVLRTVYVHFPFTARLHSVLVNIGTRKGKYVDFDASVANDVFRTKLAVPRQQRTNSKVKERQLPFLNFKKGIPAGFIDIVSDDVVDIGKDFSEYIDRETESTERYLKKSLETDKLIVDLI